MKEFRNKLIVHGLMKINDKYLVIKRSIIKRGKPNVYPEYWDIPGGSVEDFETPVEALIREAKEEVNEPKKEEAKIDSKTVSELRELAKEKNIKGYSTMKKSELIEALR